MVRYRAKPVACRVRLSNSGRDIEVLLAERARWVTPGQAAVFYDQDRVIGGGFIANPRLSPALAATTEGASAH